MGLAGLLPVYKPSGLTSFQVVARLRQRLPAGTAVGHAGTLDPDAEGLLLIALGEATGWLPWLALSPKRYRFEVVLGRATHTGDGGGRLVGRSGPPWPRAAELAAAADWLRGSIWQLPPQVSALKERGERAYRRVRAGKAIWPRPRRAEVERLQVVGGEGAVWQVEAAVGSGVYVRSLAREMAEILGHAAHVARLQRLGLGPLGVEQALPLAEVERLAEAGQLAPTLGFQGLLAVPAVEVPRAAAAAIGAGVPLNRARGLTLPKASGLHALVHGDAWLAVVEIDAQSARYRRVFPEACRAAAAQ